MREDQPYMQDEEWNELPLPGQEESWRKMEELLDKEEKRRIIPPFFLNCAGIALTIAVVIAAAWFAFRPGGMLNEKKIAKSENEPPVSTKNPLANKISATTDQPAPETQNNASSETDRSKMPEIETDGSKSNSNHTSLNITTDNSPLRQQQSKDKNNADRREKRSANKSATTSGSSVAVKRKVEKTTPNARIDITNPPVSLNDGNPSKDVATKKDSADQYKNSQTTVIAIQNDTKNIIADVTKTDSSKKLEENASVQKVQNKKPSRFSFSAGIGVQQQLRSGSQLSYSSDYYGGKGVFSEHIPSVYFRVHHKENWFAQVEFRFGAPQLVKDYSYARKIRYDTSSNNLVVSTLRLKKLYYHQLPFSFNYNVLPRLSVGAGGVYSIFYRAVTEQEVKATNIQTGAESFSKNTQRIPGFKDSFLFKSQVQLILHTDYRWKNFSLGLRYKKDLQPYIKYTKPDGTVDEDMNDAVEVILRYRLWKSRR